MNADRRVFFISGAVALVFVLAAVLATGLVGRAFAAAQDWIVTHFGWFYILAVSVFLFFALWLLVSRHGAIRLGDDDDEPEFSYPTWFSMLFSAGMGIGLLFYGVAEPVLHFAEPRVGTVEANTVEAAKEAISTAYFHWGLHAWAVYVIVALGLAYFGYRHGLPLTIRSTLYPLLGRRIHGPLGDAVDIMAVFGTLFGVATSLGLGVLQINAGLAYNGWLGISTANQLILIAVIIAATTVSVFTGLERGIRRLSEANVALGVLLLAFVFVAGPSVFLLGAYVESVGHYLQTLLDASFRTTPYRGVEWQKAWTMFYWGWWISWAPFVGMFIARISRGRTIREFVAGVLLVPVAFTFFWFTVMGNTALHVELYGAGGMVRAVQDNVSTALFVMLDGLPWAGITSVLATLMVATFFVTSADSGALVIDILCSRGRTDAPAWQRVFWALAIGAVAAVLLLAGGLAALQAAAIITALPFAVIMLAIVASVLKSLRAEAPTAVATNGGPQIVLAEELAPETWRIDLAQTLGRPLAAPDERSPRRAAVEFVQTVVLPAFDELRAELKRHGRDVRLERHPQQAALLVLAGGRNEFSYVVHARAQPRASFSVAQASQPQFGAPMVDIVARGGLTRSLPMTAVDRHWLLRDFVEQYRAWREG
jgi:choline/glycine/proline betaine transport protein